MQKKQGEPGVSVVSPHVSDKVRSRPRSGCRRREVGRRAREKEEKLTAEVLDKFSELITTALGLVAALAWNEAIQQLFTQLFGEAGGALAAKFGYALIITLVVIFATISISRAAERAKKLEAEQAKGLLGLGRSRE